MTLSQNNMYPLVTVFLLQCSNSTVAEACNKVTATFSYKLLKQKYCFDIKFCSLVELKNRLFILLNC